MQPIITISNDIKLIIKEFSSEFIDSIKKDLTMINPDYKQAFERGYSTRGKAKYIYLYQIEEGNLALPRGYGIKFGKRIREMNIKVSYLDNRLLLEKVNFK